MARKLAAIFSTDVAGYSRLMGDDEEAIGWAEKAMRLNSRYPAHYSANLGCAYNLTRQYEEAIPVLKRTIIRNLNHLAAHLFLAVVYSESGREEEIRAAAAEILRISPIAVFN